MTEMTLMADNVLVADNMGKYAGGRHLGFWRLAERRVTAKDGTVTHPLGPTPRGILTYDADGFMSVAFHGAPFGTPGQPTGFIAYAGPYTLTGDAMDHHVAFHSDLRRIGTVNKRRVRFDGDKLILSNDENGSLNEMVWVRP
jgi:hypothetical protein